MKRFENAVFSFSCDENDIDQHTDYVRADGELVAETSITSSTAGDKAGEYLAKRIVLALNHVRGLTIAEIKALPKAKGAAPAAGDGVAT